MTENLIDAELKDDGTFIIEGVIYPPEQRHHAMSHMMTAASRSGATMLNDMIQQSFALNSAADTFCMIDVQERVAAIHKTVIDAINQVIQENVAALHGLKRVN